MNRADKKFIIFTVKITTMFCSILWLEHRGSKTMKISFLTALSLSCAISLGICSSSASAIQYYKWVDAKGTTHYTKTPPPKTAKKATTVDTYGWKNSAPTPPRTSETEVQTENSAQEQLQQPQIPENQDQQQREANEALEQSKNRAVAL